MFDPQTQLAWPFPLTTTHDGIPLGNGTLGALIWGGDSTLRITINRQDYWDHRSGKELYDETTYQNTLNLLRAGNIKEIERIYNHPATDGTMPHCPTRLPMGRFDLTLPNATTVAAGGLTMTKGQADIDTSAGTVRAIILRGTPVLAIQLPASLHDTAISPVPAYGDDVREFWTNFGYQPPEIRTDPDFAAWVQPRPTEPTMCAACLRRGNHLYLASIYAEKPNAAFDRARSLLAACADRGFDDLAAEHERWWRGYWSVSAKVHTPDADLDLLYYLGLYKLGAMADADALPAGLQGPWIEEYRMPPWAGDYHFNINVQECYWPAYAGNHPELLRPLFEMVWSWLPRLQRNARFFLGIDDGLLVPHATDDLGTRISSSYLAVIDYGCGAWIAQMMWQYYRFTGDREFLRSRAYPFMKGCLRTYEAVIEQSGGTDIAMTRSPEFSAGPGRAWGANASFQLALVHVLAQGLIEASQILNCDADLRDRWQRLDRDLPAASIADDGQGDEIFVCDDQPLDRPHRHHSHLAGVHPFDTLEYEPGGRHHELVERSYLRWIKMGMGNWSGWCVPWASMLWSRRGEGHAARHCLRIVREFFIRPGYATTHDAVHAGFTTYTERPLVMQLDATMGAAAAVMEMLVHTRKGVLHVFPAVPSDWPNARFENIRIEGGFLVSATRQANQTTQVEIVSLLGNTLHLANPFGKDSRATIHSSNTKPQAMTGHHLTVPTTPNDRLTIQPA